MMELGTLSIRKEVSIAHFSVLFYVLIFWIMKTAWSRMWHQRCGGTCCFHGNLSHIIFLLNAAFKFVYVIATSRAFEFYDYFRVTFRSLCLSGGIVL
jgi:hypothetical protein